MAIGVYLCKCVEQNTKMMLTLEGRNIGDNGDHSGTAYNRMNFSSHEWVVRKFTQQYLLTYRPLTHSFTFCNNIQIRSVNYYLIKK